MGLVRKPSPASLAGAVACLRLASSAAVLHDAAARCVSSSSLSSTSTHLSVRMKPAACSAVGAWPWCRATAGAETGCDIETPRSSDLREGGEEWESTAGADVWRGPPAGRAAMAAGVGCSSSAASCIKLEARQGAEAWGTAADGDETGGMPARRSASAGIASSAEARTSITFKLSADHATVRALPRCTML